MTDEILIKNYDLDIGISTRDKETDSNYHGYNLDNKHYLVYEEDALMGRERTDIIHGEEIVVPSVVYELVEYSMSTKIARCRPITDASILEKIALEMYNEEKNSLKQDCEK